MKATRLASIGNGLYATTSTGLSLLEQYRKLQATCPHHRLDPQGTCYQCGKKQVN